MKLSDKAYEILKWIVVIVMPAVTTFYGALAPVWGFENADKVLTTMAAVTTLMGALVGVSTMSYRADQGNE